MPQSATDAAATLRIVSWNLNGLDEARLDERTAAARDEILLGERLPDAVLLQEVVRRSLLAHLRPHLQAAGYREICDPSGGYFCAIFAAPWLELTGARAIDFPGSAMGRGLLEIDARWAGAPLRIATAHLESTAGFAAERKRQLASVAERLSGWEGPAVFAGDTNLRDAEVAATPAAAALEDAWEALGGPGDRRWTWDLRRLERRGPVRRARFDRCFLNRWPGWRPARLRLLGAAAIPGAPNVYPSDHLGLEVELALEPRPEEVRGEG